MGTPVELDIQKDVIFQIPYGLSLVDLKLEPGADETMLADELHWLMENGTEEELPRVLTAALILHKIRGFPITACLTTAIIWERG